MKSSTKIVFENNVEVSPNCSVSQSFILIVQSAQSKIDVVAGTGSAAVLHHSE